MVRFQGALPLLFIAFKMLTSFLQHFYQAEAEFTLAILPPIPLDPVFGEGRALLPFLTPAELVIFPEALFMSKPKPSPVSS